VTPGDAIVGLPSIGLHTNGYTLARKLISEDEYDAPFDGTTYGDALLAAHPSYYNDVRAIQKIAKVKVMAHITGGGLLENVPRTLPPGVKAVFEQSRWTVPPIFAELSKRGNLQHEEKYRTFNMGVGYTLVVPFTDAPKAVAAVPGAKVVGWIESRAQGDPQVVVHPARASA
jgi:phosphoribosylformylglycinamidine cyclo-ligase